MKFSRFAAALMVASAFSLLAIHAADAAEPKQKVYTIGFLWGLPPIAEWIAAFDQGLRERGWNSGQNIVIEHRSSNGQDDLLPALAAELVESQVALIVALSGAGNARSPTGYKYPSDRLCRSWRSPADRRYTEPRPSRRQCDGAFAIASDAQH
jgi:hypothetical protein